MDIPIFSLLVTFLHELGHATAALLSGGHVHSLQVNPDGSGLCTTAGGLRPVVIAGGYLGSIIFGNLMLYFGIKHKHLSRFLAMILSLTMVAVSLIWFSTPMSFLITLAMGLALTWLFWKVAWSGRWFMIIAGAYSILYIIKDYQIGPSSDLSAFAEVMGLTPLIWMYIWLATAVVITGLSVKRILT